MIAYPNGRWTSKNFGASGGVDGHAETCTAGMMQDNAALVGIKPGPLAPDPLSPLKDLTELVRPILWPAEKVVEG